MASDLDKILIIEVFPLLAGVEQEAIFFTTWAPWATASTDSPASKPAVALIDGSSVSWGRTDFEFTQDGLFLPGGVARYAGTSVTVYNPVDELDKTAPLDVLAPYTFEDARAVMYLSDPDTSGALPSLQIALADLDPWSHARVETFDLEPGSDGTSLLRLGPPATLETEALWWAWRGLGTAQRCTSATRVDQASLRTHTTSHTWIVIGRWPQPATATWLNSPLFRVVDNAGTNAIDLRYRNASGSYQSSGATLSASTSGYYILHGVYTYAAGAGTFKFYVDGVETGSATITGGLYASAASAATTINSSGGNTWAIAGLQHFPIALTVDEIAASARRGIEEDSRADLTCNFNEATGNVAIDTAASLHFSITGATWPGTGEGEPAAAETRPPALIGIPFGCPLLMIDSFNGLGTPGYAGERVNLSNLTEKGLRRQPTQTIASASTTLNLTNQTITPIPRADGVEFAQGSGIVLDAYSPGATPAGNPSSYTIAQVLGRSLANQTVTVVVTGITATETITTTVSDNADGDWVFATSGAIIIRAGANVAVPALVLSTAPTDFLQVSVAINSGDSAISAIDHTLQAFGSRESSPTIARESSGAKLFQHGWRHDGARPFSELLHVIARSSIAENGNGPLSVYYKQNGNVAVRGMWLDMQTDDVYIPPDSVQSIVEAEGTKRARPGKVTVQYQTNWAPITEASSGSDDRLENDLHKPGRTVDAGTGRAALVHSSLSFYGQARSHADALLRLQGFSVYKVRCQGPLPASLIRDATNGPFLQTSIEWEGRSTWQTPKVGIIVGATARPFAREGETALELIFATED